jgi:hypothetical protein
MGGLSFIFLPSEEYKNITNAQRSAWTNSSQTKILFKIMVFGDQLIAYFLLP